MFVLSNIVCMIRLLSGCLGTLSSSVFWNLNNIPFVGNGTMGGRVGLPLVWLPAGVDTAASVGSSSSSSSSQSKMFASLL